MAPRMSSWPKARFTELVELVAHMPSVVPRTVIRTGSPPRLWLATKVHMVGSSCSSHPAEGWGGCSVSTVWVAHFVTTCMYVAVLLKSTSNSLYALPNGVHMTLMTFMSGGTIVPSDG